LLREFWPFPRVDDRCVTARLRADLSEFNSVNDRQEKSEYLSTADDGAGLSIELVDSVIPIVSYLCSIGTPVRIPSEHDMAATGQ